MRRHNVHAAFCNGTKSEYGCFSFGPKAVREIFLQIRQDDVENGCPIIDGEDVQRRCRALSKTPDIFGIAIVPFLVVFFVLDFPIAEIVIL